MISTTRRTLELASEIKEYSDDEDARRIVLAIPVHPPVPGTPATQITETVVVLEPVAQIAVLPSRPSLYPFPRLQTPVAKRPSAAARRHPPATKAAKSHGESRRQTAKRPHLEVAPRKP